MEIETLIEAVRLCGSTPKVDQCNQCAYWSGGDMSKCIPRMTTDAAAALSTLQAGNEKLRAELEQVKRERDAAVDGLRVCSIENNMECQYCLYRTARSFCWNCTDGSNWKFHGQKEE